MRIVYTIPWDIMASATFSTISKIRRRLTEKLARVEMGHVLDTPSGTLKNVIVEKADAIVGVRDLLELLEALDVGLSGLPARTGAGCGDGVCRVKYPMAWQAISLSVDERNWTPSETRNALRARVSTRVPLCASATSSIFC